jgi:hypothetical protein
MVNLRDAALGGAIVWGVNQTLDKVAAEASEETATQDGVTQAQQKAVDLRTDSTVNTDLERQLSQLNERQRRNNPPADAMHAWYSTTITDLSPGGQAEIEITPNSGFAEEFERIEFTNEDNHSYSIEVGGVEVATGPKAVLKPPRELGPGQKVVATVTNNTDDAGTNRTTDLDFEAQSWGYPTRAGAGGQ